MQEGGNAEGAAAAPEAAHEEVRPNFGLFRRPEKFKIGEDFDLFARKIDLYFEAVEVTDERKKRLAFLFNLNEDAFRLAEGVSFPADGDRKYERWLNELKTLFERNETLTEKRYNSHKRTQAVGETVDSFAIGLREYGAKCGFAGNEYNNRLVDKFILGLLDKQTQTRLLQEPPGTLDEALVVARRFEAVRSTMQTLRHDTNTGKSMAGAVHADKVCFNCNQSGNIAKYCRKGQFNTHNPIRVQQPGKICFNCQQAGHISPFCPFKKSNSDKNNSVQGRDVVVCYRCGEKGHHGIVKAFCRERVKQVKPLLQVM